MAGCKFEPAKEIGAFQSYQDRLGVVNPDWSPDFLHKQALIAYNEEMYPLQVKSFFAEKNGDSDTSTGQTFQIINGGLVNQHYDFSKMISHATSEAEKNSMVDFQDKAIAAKVGEKVHVLDLSALGNGGGVKYLDVYEKESEMSIKHKGRINLNGAGPDLSLEQAEEILAEMDLAVDSEKSVDLLLTPMLPEAVLTPPTETLKARGDRVIETESTSFWRQSLPEISLLEPAVIETFQSISVSSLEERPTFLYSDRNTKTLSSQVFQVEIKNKMPVAINSTSTKFVVFRDSPEESLTGSSSGVFPEQSMNPGPDSSGSDPSEPEGSGGGEPIKPRPDGPGGGVRDTIKPTRRDLVGPEVVEPEPTKTVFEAPKINGQVIEKKAPVHIVEAKQEEKKLLVPNEDEWLKETAKQKQSTLLYGDRMIKALNYQEEVGKRIDESNAAVSRLSKIVTERRVVYERKQLSNTVSQLRPSIRGASSDIAKILPPELEIITEPLNDKEIPFWQAGFDPEEDLTILVLAMFWLILNTKWLQPKINFNDLRGSGWARGATVVYSS